MEHARIQVLQKMPDGDAWSMFHDYEPPTLKRRREKEATHHAEMKKEQRQVLTAE